MTTTFAEPVPGAEHRSDYSGTAGRPAPVPTSIPVGMVTPFSAAAMGELVYCLIGLVPAIVFFVGTVTLLSVGVGLAVIYLGVLVLAAGLVFARVGGYLQRVLARVLLDMPTAEFRPLQMKKNSPLGWVAAVLTDPVGWRAVAYHCVKMLLAPISFSVAVTVYAYGIGGVTYPLWYRWLPAMRADDGSFHHGLQWAPNMWVDSMWTMAVQFVLALGVLLIAPRVVRMLTTLDRVLVAVLLSPRSALAG